MRKIAAQLFIALDGVVEAPDQWHFPYFNEEMGAAVDATPGSADTLLLGRRTYEGFAAAWPGREEAGGEDAPFTKVLGDARKIIASRGRPDLSWRNSERITGSLAEAVTALKGEPGAGRVWISGSASVVRHLPAAGLLDELNLLVHPIAVGKGLRLFPEGEPTVPLEPLSCTPFRTGVLDLVHAPAAAPAPAGYTEARAHLPRHDTPQ
ncbi:deaminase reductase [Streptomyces lavendulae subsp. lavendulae]|uniref:dihydrofolate reductase family protein n=1 Tax=Streptomyces lavendulae TaxID=1914 RepID=UPI0024A5E005|nr:dihydrofolate reductase family protein [Streptomyces lavendulae]GLV84556.1 deaminase reductase [Streptomyces lavendulae subsp. lavendulae]